MLVFTGNYEYTMDDKGRLSMPARMRDQLLRAGQEMVFYITQGRLGNLNAYSQAAYEELVQNLGSRTDEEAGIALRTIASETEECQVDKQGRVVIPQRLRQYAGIGRDVVILGVSKRVEIWSKEKYETFSKQNNLSVQKAYGALQGPADLV